VKVTRYSREETYACQRAAAACSCYTTRPCRLLPIPETRGGSCGAAVELLLFGGSRGPSLLVVMVPHIECELDQPLATWLL
jgi:hypothetical protein